MGFAGNNEPQFIMPSAIAVKETARVGDGRVTRGVEDLDFYIGDEAMRIGNPYTVKVRIAKSLLDIQQIIDFIVVEWSEIFSSIQFKVSYRFFI